MSADDGSCLLWCHETVHCVLVPDLDVIQVELRTIHGRTFLRKSAASHQDARNEAEYLRLLFRAGRHRVRPGNLKPFALVIDEDSDGGEGTIEALKVAGMRVFGCRSGVEGVSLARELAPDLIVVEYGMSDGSSEVVCRVLREDEATQAIPVMVLTEAPETVPAVADAILAKPCQPTTLAAAANLFVRHLSDAS